MQQLTHDNNSASAACAREILATIPLVMRFLRGQMRHHRGRELTVPQFRALIFTNTMPAATLSDLAEHVGLSLPAASRLVGGLVRRGLLARRARPDNRRCVALTLTARGRAAFESAYDCTRQALADQLAALSLRELEQVTRGVRVLHEVFDADGAPECARAAAHGGHRGTPPGSAAARNGAGV